MMMIALSGCGAMMPSQPAIDTYQVLYQPITTSRHDTCSTILQADKQACTYYNLYGTQEQKKNCKENRIYQEIYQNGQRMGCKVTKE